MRGQLFKCTKCGVELPKDKFRKHLMRKTPCYVQSGIDFIIAEYDRMIEKFETLNKFTKDDIYYFENRLDDMLKFHDNLDETEKDKSKKYFDEFVKPYYDRMRSRSKPLKPVIETVESDSDLEG